MIVEEVVLSLDDIKCMELDYKLEMYFSILDSYAKLKEMQENAKYIGNDISEYKQIVIQEASTPSPSKKGFLQTIIDMLKSLFEFISAKFKKIFGISDKDTKKVEEKINSNANNMVQKQIQADSSASNTTDQVSDNGPLKQIAIRTGCTIALAATGGVITYKFFMKNSKQVASVTGEKSNTASTEQEKPKVKEPEKVTASYEELEKQLKDTENDRFKNIENSVKKAEEERREEERRENCVKYNFDADKTTQIFVNVFDITKEYSECMIDNATININEIESKINDTKKLISEVMTNTKDESDIEKIKKAVEEMENKIKQISELRKKTSTAIQEKEKLSTKLSTIGKYKESIENSYNDEQAKFSRLFEDFMSKELTEFSEHMKSLADKIEQLSGEFTNLRDFKPGDGISDFALQSGKERIASYKHFNVDKIYKDVIDWLNRGNSISDIITIQKTPMLNYNLNDYTDADLKQLNDSKNFKRMNSDLVVIRSTCNISLNQRNRNTGGSHWSTIFNNNNAPATDEFFYEITGKDMYSNGANDSYKEEIIPRLLCLLKYNIIKANKANNFAEYKKYLEMMFNLLGVQDYHLFKICLIHFGGHNIERNDSSVKEIFDKMHSSTIEPTEPSFDTEFFEFAYISDDTELIVNEDDLLLHFTKQEFEGNDTNLQPTFRDRMNKYMYCSQRVYFFHTKKLPRDAIEPIKKFYGSVIYKYNPLQDSKPIYIDSETNDQYRDKIKTSSIGDDITFKNILFTSVFIESEEPLHVELVKDDNELASIGETIGEEARRNSTVINENIVSFIKTFNTDNSKDNTNKKWEEFIRNYGISKYMYKVNSNTISEKDYHEYMAIDTWQSRSDLKPISKLFKYIWYKLIKTDRYNNADYFLIKNIKMIPLLDYSDSTQYTHRFSFFYSPFIAELLQIAIFNIIINMDESLIKNKRLLKDHRLTQIKAYHPIQKIIDNMINNNMLNADIIPDIFTGIIRDMGKKALNEYCECLNEIKQKISNDKRVYVYDFLYTYNDYRNNGFVKEQADLDERDFKEHFDDVKNYALTLEMINLDGLQNFVYNEDISSSKKLSAIINLMLECRDDDNLFASCISDINEADKNNKLRYCIPRDEITILNLLYQLFLLPEDDIKDVFNMTLGKSVHFPADVGKVKSRISEFIKNKGLINLDTDGLKDNPIVQTFNAAYNENINKIIKALGDSTVVF